MACGKIKTSARKKIQFEPDLPKKPLLKGKKRKLFVTLVTYIDVLVIYKCKYLWRRRLVGLQLLVDSAIRLCVLLSHRENDLFPHETLIVLSYESFVMIQVSHPY